MLKLRTMKIALYKSEKDTLAEVKEVTWEELTDMLSKPRISNNKFGAAWSPTDLSKPFRKNENVINLTALVLDIDGIKEEEFARLQERIRDFRYIKHSTFSDKQDLRCLRLIVAINSPVARASWPGFLRAFVSKYQIPADTACKDFSRLYFLPCRPRGADYFFESHEGDPVDVEEILMLSLRTQDRSGVEERQASVCTLPALLNAAEWLRAHGPAIEGQNGDLHTYIAAAALTHDFALSEEEAWPLLKAWNRQNKPPWTEAELLLKAKNAEQYATEPYGSKRPDSEQLIAYGENLEDFLGDKEPEEEETWLLKGLIAAGVPQIIAGPPKSMKSYMALSMALSLAAGKPWIHGDFLPVRRCKVLLLPKEDSASETKRRLWWLSRGMGVAPPELSDYIFIDAESSFHLDDEAEVRKMQSTIEQLKPDLIIVDSLTEVHRRDENSAADMKVVIDNWGTLCRRNNVAIACIHHLRKQNEGFPSSGSVGGRLRGSSTLHARVRHILGVEAKERAVSKVRCEGNLQGLPDDFLVRMQESVDAAGRPAYRMSFNGWV